MEHPENSEEYKGLVVNKVADCYLSYSWQAQTEELNQKLSFASHLPPIL